MPEKSRGDSLADLLNDQAIVPIVSRVGRTDSWRVQACSPFGPWRGYSELTLTQDINGGIFALLTKNGQSARFVDGNWVVFDPTKE